VKCNVFAGVVTANLLNDDVLVVLEVSDQQDHRHGGLVFCFHESTETKICGIIHGEKPIVRAPKALFLDRTCVNKEPLARSVTSRLLFFVGVLLFQFCKGTTCAVIELICDMPVIKFGGLPYNRFGCMT